MRFPVFNCWLLQQLFTHRLQNAVQAMIPSCIIANPLTFLYFWSLVPSAVGFRTLLTFDSPLPGIKYSWALYTALLRGTLHRPRNPQEISKVLLPWPSLRNTFERYASNRNPETNATESLLNFAVFLEKPKLLAFYYVFGGASVSAQLSRNCQQTLASLSISRQFYPIESRYFATTKIHTEIDSFALAKENVT